MLDCKSGMDHVLDFGISDATGCPCARGLKIFQVQPVAPVQKIPSLTPTQYIMDELNKN